MHYAYLFMNVIPPFSQVPFQYIKFDQELLNLGIKFPVKNIVFSNIQNLNKDSASCSCALNTTL